MNNKIEALKAVECANPIFPRKKTAALSLMPRSPMEIGSIDLTSITDDNAKKVIGKFVTSKALANRQY